MFIAIVSNITDQQKWEEAAQKIGPMVEEGRLPKGLNALLFIPSTDSRKAVSVWEADSVENLKRFLEPLSGGAVRAEYFQINPERAYGLPLHSPQHAAAR